MRKVVGLCGALVACAVPLAWPTSAARGAPSASWRNNPISAAAILADPTLANMQSWSLMFSNTEGFWAAAGLRAVLPAGHVFYRHANGGNFRPSIAQQAADPALTYHTYVTSPRQSLDGVQGAPLIIGGWPENEPLSFGANGIFSVAWGDLSAPSGPPGPLTVEIARLTFPQGVIPTVLTTGPNRSLVVQISPDQEAPIPSIPEPAAGCYIAATASSLLLRARRTLRASIE